MCSDHLALIIALGGIDGQRAVGIGYRARNRYTKFGSSWCALEKIIYRIPGGTEAGSFQ
jgi:hypothetical protein